MGIFDVATHSKQPTHTHTLEVSWKETPGRKALARISGFCGFLTEHRLPSDTVQGYALVGATAKHPGREMGAECRWSI